MKASIIKPGLLVSLKTTVKGGADYMRTELERDHSTEEGARRARWETTRIIADPAEYEAAIKARGLARQAIMTVCCNSAFGLLCPSARETDLTTAIDVARGIADEFNAKSQRAIVEVYIITGRVAQDDVEAARAIGAEVRDLLDAMQQGINQADPEAIREAASKARQIGGMLTDETAVKVNDAISEARKAARDIVKRVSKAGEDAAKVVASLSIKSIDAARFAFLDLDGPATVESEAPDAWAVDFAPECELPAAFIDNRQPQEEV